MENRLAVGDQNLLSIADHGVIVGTRLVALGLLLSTSSLAPSASQTFAC